MPSWLIVYERKAGHLARCDEYADSGEALAGRFRLERDADADTEIVVLGADSLETLKTTHGRYFYDAAALARRCRDLILARVSLRLHSQLPRQGRINSRPVLRLAAAAFGAALLAQSPLGDVRREAPAVRYYDDPAAALVAGDQLFAGRKPRSSGRG